MVTDDQQVFELLLALNLIALCLLLPGIQLVIT